MISSQKMSRAAGKLMAAFQENQSIDMVLRLSGLMQAVSMIMQAIDLKTITHQLSILMI